MDHQGSSTHPADPAAVIEAALEAHERGWQPVAIKHGSKRPYGAQWQHMRWDDASPELVRTSFEKWAELGAPGIGLILGEPSGGLVDVDLDHPKALRLKDHFLPATPMQTGRAGRPRSHRWYLTEPGTLPASKAYKLPGGSVSVEIRATGAQTVIPPSRWFPKEWDGSALAVETYRWEGEPWGGTDGPKVVSGRVLAVQVALLGLGAVLLDAWPNQGGRHDAYLALAGGLLRQGDGVHPYWQRNLPTLISALADTTNDDDGPEQRVSEVMRSTLSRLTERGHAVGFPRLGELIGVDHAEMARRIARDVEKLAGYEPPEIQRLDDRPSSTAPSAHPAADVPGDDDGLPSSLPPVERDPLAERVSTWSAVDLDPYLTGEIVMPVPSILTRTDGASLFYPGRVNLLFGPSESAKSWVALYASMQEIAAGGRVLYLDFEDGPEGMIGRAQQLGAGADDLHHAFRYVQPEGPLASMQRYKFGPAPTEGGLRNEEAFAGLLSTFDPTLIVADGMTVLYGLHGHDTNDSSATEVITGWLKRLCQGGRTVVLIDHTGKGGGAGSSPIGSQHKIAMVQGTALRVDVGDRPMPGAVGNVRLIVFKDRPGLVRRISSTTGSEQVAAEVSLDSREQGITRVKVEPPDPSTVVVGSSTAQEAMLAKLAEQESMRQRILGSFGGDIDQEWTSAEIASHIGEADVRKVREAIPMLKASGELQQIGAKRYTRYKLNVTAPANRGATLRNTTQQPTQTTQGEERGDD